MVYLEPSYNSPHRSVVTKLKPFQSIEEKPIIRASGHTFEYVGFGPGNYSTALPEKQDRVLTPQNRSDHKLEDRMVVWSTTLE